MLLLLKPRIRLGGGGGGGPPVAVATEALLALEEVLDGVAMTLDIAEPVPRPPAPPADSSVDSSRKESSIEGDVSDGTAP